MFLGCTFSASSKAFQNVEENNPSFNALTIKNCYIDKLYGKMNYIDSSEEGFIYDVPDGWPYGTIFNADFRNDLSGGNITYSTQSIKGIKIKRKLESEKNWKTIYYKTPVESSADFDLLDEDGKNLIDFLEPNNQKVQYMYVPVFKAETEGTADRDINSSIVEVNSWFTADMVVGRNNNGVMTGYPARINETLNYQRNRNSSTVTTLGSKYPFVVNNGLTNYYSGSMQATFIMMDEDSVLDTEGVREYRNNLDDFLTNGMAKLIKTNEGNMYMVAMNESISHNDGGTYFDPDKSQVRLYDTSFNQTEIGDAYSVGDLYDNNFINTEVDRKVE